MLTKRSLSSCCRIFLQSFCHSELLGLYFSMLSEYPLGSSMISPRVPDSVYMYVAIDSLGVCTLFKFGI